MREQVHFTANLSTLYEQHAQTYNAACDLLREVSDQNENLRKQHQRDTSELMLAFEIMMLSTLLET